MAAPGELTPDPAALDIVLETSERLACAALRRPARVRWLAKRKSRDKRYMNEMQLRSCCRSRMGGRGRLRAVEDSRCVAGLLTKGCTCLLYGWAWSFLSVMRRVVIKPLSSGVVGLA